jgi:hypothetical protein
MYVIETDAPCKGCGDTHNYVTQMCTLAVFVDFVTAKYVSHAISGSIVREIEEVPEGLSYTLYLHKNGRPNAAHSTKSASLSRR